MGGGGPPGLFQDPRLNWWSPSTGFIGRRAAFQGSLRVFLGDRNSDLPGLRFDGNISDSQFELPAEPSRKFGPADRQRADSDCGRWRDSSEGALRHAGLLQVARIDAGSSLRG